MAELRQRSSGPKPDECMEGGGTRWVKPGPTSTPNQGKLLAGVIGIPLVTLIIIYPTLVYIYSDPIAPYPCKGVCSISEEMRVSAPEGCSPIGPPKVVFTHIHKTGGTSMRALLESRKHEKEWELVFMKEWRDAVPNGVVHLPPKELARISAEQYEKTHRFMNGWLHRVRPHSMLYFGHVFFNNFNQPWDDADLERHPPIPRDQVTYITMLREPIARMASQYYFDTYRAKHKTYQEQMKRRQGGRSFGECVKDGPCRIGIELERWCNTQTRYLCGWGPECQSNKPTQQMLDTAMRNFDEHIFIAGIQEEWLTSIRLFEKLMPTYFEGLEKEYDTGNNLNCEIWGWDWWTGKKCEYQRNVNTEKRADELDGEAKQILADKCWADITLYQHAHKRFQHQAATCLA